MGCKGSKSKKNAYARVAQYQKESWVAEHALRFHPKPLEWVTPPTGCITPTCVHNLLTDGFYAPFVANPNYLLLIDCRPKKSFDGSRLTSSIWFDDLRATPDPTKCCFVVLYDDIPRISPPSPNDRDPLALLYHKLKRQKLEPTVVVGGWPAIEIICQHLTVIGRSGEETLLPSPWYPTLIIPGFLFLGHSEMSNDRRLLLRLDVSHIITLSDVIPNRVLPSTNYLVVPLSDSESSGGIDLVPAMPTILAFIDEAQETGGSVLVQCDQGFTRAAVVVMAILMADRRCSLEDAFYFVRGARSAVQPNDCLLEQLLLYEIALFGGSVSVIEELF